MDHLSYQLSKKAMTYIGIVLLIISVVISWIKGPEIASKWFIDTLTTYVANPAANSIKAKSEAVGNSLQEIILKNKTQ